MHVHLVPTLAGVGVGGVVVVEGAEAHHAVAVRRLQPGEQVALTDGVGTTARGVVAGAARARLEVEVVSVADEPRPDPGLCVVQALPKGDRGELAVEVLTEIGVDRIVPWTAERCQVSWRGERGAKALGRWRSTAREAAKQARRAWHPEVLDPSGTDQVAALLQQSELALVLHEAATRPLAMLDVPATGAITLVVGPEGGLTDAEVEAFAAVGAHVVHLGAEVLRTSTAGVAAAAALLAGTPRWRVRGSGG